EAAVDFGRTVVRERDDGAGEGYFRWIPGRGRERIDRRLDFFDLGFVFGFVQACIEPLLLDLFGFRKRAAFFTHTLRKLVPGHALEGDFDPGPAFAADFLDDGLKFLFGEPIEEVAIG